jgi:hypothetical protein
VTRPPPWPQTRLALVAWIIWWVGDHDWRACLRLIALLLAAAMAVCGLIAILAFYHAN